MLTQRFVRVKEPQSKREKLLRKLAMDAIGVLSHDSSIISDCEMEPEAAHAVETLERQFAKTLEGKWPK